MTGEFDGHGGTYLLDPASGQRTLLRRTTDAPRGAELPTPPTAPDVQIDAEPIHATEQEMP